MSPNLSSQHFAPNAILYEQVLYSIFHLVGLAGAVKNPSNLQSNELNMLVGPRSLSAEAKECSSQCSDG
jgi:tubulin monoglycylase TTLL15